MSDLTRIRADIPTDDKIKALRKLWARRGEEAGVHVDIRAESRTPAAPRASTDPVQIRLGWYIPPRHKDDTLDNFRPLTPSQRVALDAARDWVESVKVGTGATLALVGGVGCGKSHLMYAAIRAANEAGVHAAAYGWVELADVIRASKFAHDVEEYNEAREKRDRLYQAAKAFGLDEIRPTSGTDFDGTELAQLMTRAYRNCQGVIVTSNFADTKLAEIIGLAAQSRLTQLTVEGPNLRPVEARERHLRAV